MTNFDQSKHPRTAAGTSKGGQFAEKPNSAPEAGLEPEPLVNGRGTLVWLNAAGELHRDGDRPAIVFADGRQEWYRNDKLHRDGDQPAIIEADGGRQWWVDGKLHRDGDQPAAVGADGAKQWWVNDKLNRDGGQPALIRADGAKQWWVDGVFVREVPGPR